MVTKYAGKAVLSGCAALMYLASPVLCAAAGTAPNVTFTATGTFSNPAVSGNDTLRLAGEPFTIQIVASAASVPIQHGSNWALFSPFKMTGTVHSGLLGPTAIAIASGGASILQAVGPDYDPVTTGFPVKVVGFNLTIEAQFVLPAGTLSKPLIHPFSPIALAPGNTTVTYSNGTDSTVLTVDSGTLVAVPTAPTGAQMGGVQASGAVGWANIGGMYAEEADRPRFLRSRLG